MRSSTKILLVILILLFLTRFGRYLILLSLKFWLVLFVIIFFIYLYHRFFKRLKTNNRKSDLKGEIKNTKWTVEDDEEDS
ncbi:MAG: hypothetical protein JW996_00115 [Candidatus Cloacimonetes bacterium]|nr:hypothetical protein [Candidatus Cloacimonadota bacterium]